MLLIELGGEDAKIIYFTGGNIEQRMNGICVVVGPLFDQMCPSEFTHLAEMNMQKIIKLYYTLRRAAACSPNPIYSPNHEGATKTCPYPFFRQLLNQTISGLDGGKPIRGTLAFLGGPLHFLSELKNCFIRTLKLSEQVIAPDNSH